MEGELDDLRAFVGVVEAGGFSRAAARLGLAKSIVSRRVARLEASLGGARLLARTTRGVSPTEAGAAFHARCVRVLAELDEAREEVAGREAELVGTLRLAAPLSFGIAHLAPALARFAAEHPRLALDVAYSDRMVDLVAERFDAAVRIGALVDSSLVARRLAPVRLVAVASPAYLERRGVPETPADLARHDCLVYSAGAEGTAAAFGGSAPAAAASPPPCARTAASAPTTARRWWPRRWKGWASRCCRPFSRAERCGAARWCRCSAPSPCRNRGCTWCGRRAGRLRRGCGR